MQIFVKTVTGRIYGPDVPQSATIRDVKAMMAPIIGLPPEELMLVIEGEEEEDLNKPLLRNQDLFLYIGRANFPGSGKKYEEPHPEVKHFLCERGNKRVIISSLSGNIRPGQKKELVFSHPSGWGKEEEKEKEKEEEEPEEEPEEEEKKEESKKKFPVVSEICIEAEKKEEEDEEEEEEEKEKKKKRRRRIRGKKNN